MNRRFPSYPTSPKRPPPEDGIKSKKAGTTWWGKRWIEALEHVLRGDAGRLARGRTYARAGRIHDLAVAGGVVTARATGSRTTPYAVRIELEPLSDQAWNAAIINMAQSARFAAELLSGQMPADIDQAFEPAGASLFPTRRSELSTDCSCPDWGDPCKHVAAAHIVLGEAFDRDPFLLFELRGREKPRVLDALRAARAAESHVDEGFAVEPGRDATEAAIPSVRLEGITDEAYETPRQSLPAISFSFDPPRAHEAVLRQLGAPPGWSYAAPPADVLSPLLRAAAERARAIALSAPDEEGGETPSVTTGGIVDATAALMAAPNERAPKKKVRPARSTKRRQRPER